MWKLYEVSYNSPDTGIFLKVNGSALCDGLGGDTVGSILTEVEVSIECTMLIHKHRTWADGLHAFFCGSLDSLDKTPQELASRQSGYANSTRGCLCPREFAFVMHHPKHRIYK